MIANFRKIFDYKVFNSDNHDDEIFQDVLELTKMLEAKNLTHFGNLLRKVVERTFAYHENLPTPETRLVDSIITLKQNITLIPTNVLDGLYLIKNLSNRESHANYRKSDINFNVKITGYEAETAIRNLWLIFKWIMVDINGNDEISSINYENENNQNISSSNPELENQNDDMQPEKLSIASLIMTGEYTFNIPTYQRDYNWDVKKNKNIPKLLEDIKSRSKDNKTHYFGSLAIAIDEKNKIFRIIDGQQRITSSMIFLKAFYDVFKDKKIEPQKELEYFMKNKISKIYVNDGVLSDQRAVKILFDNRHDPSESINPRQNYLFIMDELMNLSKEKLLSFYTTFLTKFEVVTLVFKTSIDNEMDIFENLNTGGTKLEDWDLIRSFIFSRMDPNSFIEYEKLANEYLNSTFMIPLNSVTKGKYKPQMNKFITIYVRYLLAIYQKRTIVNEAHVEFKKCWINNEKYINYNDWKDSLAIMQKAFSVFMSFKFYYKEQVSNPFHGYYPIVDFINSKDDLMPLIINVALREGTFNEKNELIKINKKIVKTLKIMESYLIRSNTFGKNFNAQYDTFLINNYKFISENLWNFYKNNLTEKMVSLEQFGFDLENNGRLTRSKIMNIISRIELKLRDIELGKTGYTKLEKTHEHIIAQNLAYENYDDQRINIEQYQNLLEENKDSVGNALILAQGYNSSAGNLKFIEKIQTYEKASYLSKGHIDNPIIMNLLSKRTFTFDDVKIRAKQIAEFVKSKKIYYEE